MKAVRRLQERVKLSAIGFADVTIWQVPTPVRGSEHGYKYRLALVIDGVCVLRYDNEAGKGDHKHIGDLEVPYEFTTLDRLIEDFWADVTRMRGPHDDT